MTADWAITAEKLGKQYLIRHRTGGSYVALRDVMADGTRRLGRRLIHPLGGSSNGRSDPSREAFWALRDVSFTIQPGERVGIIGRNGAGKSTLLKILSRITDPSAGRLGIRGRVASLLEVGTGFHPELTGRENIYLNGAVLGMSRVDIKRKFDEIVAFAEVEQFLDTPVKRYSSGMYVRLAFAVAAHLEPEILIVDEVLAVGDASFQKKCLGKMEEVGGEGRTVLFVSHNMAAITRLCERAILLERGNIVSDGTAHSVVSTYLQSGLGSTAAREWSDAGATPSDGAVRLRAVRVRNESGEVSDAIDIRQAIGIEVEYEVLQSGHVLLPNCRFFNEEGTLAFTSADCSAEWRRSPKQVGTYTSVLRVPGNFLAEGSLSVSVAINTMDPLIFHAFEENAVAFQVIDSMDGNTARGDYAGPMPGVVRPLLDWSTHISSTLDSHHETDQAFELVSEGNRTPA
jgi:lipopolysaccharide transport system ATP-binding protein